MLQGNDRERSNEIRSFSRSRSFRSCPPINHGIVVSSSTTFRLIFGKKAASYRVNNGVSSDPSNPRKTEILWKVGIVGAFTRRLFDRGTCASFPPEVAASFPVSYDERCETELALTAKKTSLFIVTAIGGAYTTDSSSSFRLSSFVPYRKHRCRRTSTNATTIGKRSLRFERRSRRERSPRKVIRASSFRSIDETIERERESFGGKKSRKKEKARGRWKKGAEKRERGEVSRGVRSYP